MQAKKMRMVIKLDAMLVEGWELQGALALLVMHGFGEFISREEESGFYFVKAV